MHSTGKIGSFGEKRIEKTLFPVERLKRRVMLTGHSSIHSQRQQYIKINRKSRSEQKLKQPQLQHFITNKLLKQPIK